MCGEMRDYAEQRQAQGDGRDRQEDFHSSVSAAHVILPDVEFACGPFPERLFRFFPMRMIAPDAPQRSRYGDGDEDQPTRDGEQIVGITATAEGPGGEYIPESQSRKRQIETGMKMIGKLAASADRSSWS